MNDFRHELSDFADQTEVNQGSAAMVATRARRRTQVSVAARVSAVALVATAGVVGVNALSSPGLDGDPIDAPNGVASAEGTTPTGSTTPVDPNATAPPVAGSNGPPDDDWLASAPQTRPAEYVDLDYTWTAYPIDSPEALALRFNPDEKYAVSTADGDGGIYPEALYTQTADGWQLVSKFDSVEQVNGSAMIGDTIYVSVTNAESSDIDYDLRAYDSATDGWSEVPLPDGAKAPLPADSKLDVGYFATLSERDGTVYMLESRSYDLDMEKLGMPDSEISYGRTPDSVEIADASCLAAADQEMQEYKDQYLGDEEWSSTVPETELADTTTEPEAQNTATSTVESGAVDSGPAESATTTPASEVSTETPLMETTVPVAGAAASSSPEDADVDPFEACFRPITLDELGLSQADQELFERSPDYMSRDERLWTFDGAQWTERDLPGAATDRKELWDGGVISAYPMLSVQDDDYFGTYPGPATFYEAHGDGSFVPLFDGNRFAGNTLASSGPPAASNRVMAGTGPYVLNQDLEAGSWTATDLSALGDQVGWGRFSAEVSPDYAGSDGSMVATGRVASHLPTEQVELTSGQYTLQLPLDPEDRAVLIDNATGETTTNAYVTTEAGRVIAEFTPEDPAAETVFAEFDADWTSIPYLNVASDSALFISDDGVRFGVIDGQTLAKTTGVAAEGRSMVSLFGTRKQGDQIVVKGGISSENSNEEYLFVGTPN